MPSSREFSSRKGTAFFRDRSVTKKNPGSRLPGFYWIVIRSTGYYQLR
jgi:hypothetical protein